MNPTPVPSTLRKSYEDFLATKVLRAPTIGMENTPRLSGHLFQFQREAVEFGLRVGSWGCFLDTGLGKTACELEWARHAADASNGHALILTPLAVARQIEAEGRKWGYDVRVVREQSDVRPGINVCNYDRLHLLEADSFGAVALDEASILKNFIGSVSRSLIQAFSGHRWRMVATATPAPNDHTELAQHSSFLGVMSRDEMLVRWFINDTGDTGSWRLKGHAVTPFFDWMSSWARMAEHPRDLGDDVPGYDLPPFRVIRHQAKEPDAPISGGLFGGMMTATTMHDVKRQTIEARACLAARIILDEPDEPWLIFVDTNYEHDAIEDVLLRGIPEARQRLASVKGSDTPEHKETSVLQFVDGTRPWLLSKSSIVGMGLNFQHCKNMLFVGRSFSYEAWYQAVRRCWRFGQERQVQVHLIVAEGEDAIGRVIDRKADDHAKLKAEMVAAMRRAVGRSSDRRVAYNPQHMGRIPSWLYTRQEAL
jgi:hypothetical protein